MKTAVKVVLTTAVVGVLAGVAWVLVPGLIPASPEKVMAATNDAVAEIDSAQFDIATEMNVDGNPTTLDGQGEFALPLALQLSGTVTTAGQAIAIEERLVEGTLYVRIGEDGAWYAIDGALSSAGLDAQSMSATSPEQYFAYFEAVDRIEDFGTQTIRGVECRHLLLEIDEAALADLIGGAGTESTAALNAAIASSKSRVDVWIGVNDGLPYREIISTRSTEPVAMSGTTQIDFTAFDTDPTITAPSGATPLPVESR